MPRRLIALRCGAGENTGLSVTLDGELDFHASSQIEPRLMQLAEASGPQLDMDLSGLTFCDSSGIDLLLRIHQRCTAGGTRLRLTRVPHMTAVSMRVLGADRVLLSSGS
ncbi:STAS domain-containing protein [Streptomyces sp. NPDC097981]|uniref:STAS domain-containing protein n=1 Tax=Streptomyces sp. NPDC097981 TaxID=3155428 RepID=UPI00332A2EFA